MIDLNTKLDENFTEAGSIKGIMNDFLNRASKVDPTKTRTREDPTDGIAGNIAKGSKALGNLQTKLGSKTVDRGSIISKASRSVMQFPLYVSPSTRIAEAHPIGKAFERVYASFVQNVIAQDPVITDISKVNGLRFLRDYHTNIKESSEVTIGDLESIFNEYATPIDQFDEILTEAVFNEVKLPGGTVTFMACRPNPLIYLESARLAHEPLEGFRFLSEAGGSGPSRTTITTKQTVDNKDTEANLKSQPKPFEMTDKNLEANLDEYMADLGIKPLTGKDDDDRSADVNQVKKKISDAGQIVTSKGNIYQRDVTPKQNVYDKDGKTVVRVEPKKTKFTVTKRASDSKHVTKHQATTTTTTNQNDTMRSAVDAPTMLRDTDIKKFNGMQPFQFVVKFRVDPVYSSKKDAAGNDIEGTEVLKSGTNYEQSYILGVKTVMHLIRIKDLSDDLREIISGDQKGLQSVRYKTGEISWLKDYMLNLSSLKADAMKRLDDRRWLSTLKRLGEYEKINGTLLKAPAEFVNDKGIPIPNATMILTRGDIERIKDDTGINLEDIPTVRTLARRLFLIAFVIVDQTAGSFKVFFPDMDNDWDVQSIGAIDAEVAKIDNSPLMAEINRISRKG